MFRGVKAFSAYLGEDKTQWAEWDSCALMLASKPADAIPTLIDQGDSDQFLADQLQPAVLAETARQTAWPMTLRIQPVTTTAITLLRRLLRITCASMPSIC